MIGVSKNNRENYPRKCFRTPEKETRVKFSPGLSANRLSNNWAQVLSRGVLLYVNTVVTSSTAILTLQKQNLIPPPKPGKSALGTRLTQTPKKCAIINGFENVLLQGLASHSENV